MFRSGKHILRARSFGYKSYKCTFGWDLAIERLGLQFAILFEQNFNFALSLL
jgi:hypothetical protein